MRAFALSKIQLDSTKSGNASRKRLGWVLNDSYCLIIPEGKREGRGADGNVLSSQRKTGCLGGLIDLPARPKSQYMKPAASRHCCTASLAQVKRLNAAPQSPQMTMGP